MSFDECRKRCVGIVVFLATSSFFSSSSHAQATFQDLGTLPGFGAVSRPVVSANGLVVTGTVNSNTGGDLVRRAVRWTEADGLVSLGVPQTWEPALTWTEARAVSADGSIVVGNVNEDEGGFFWSEPDGFSIAGSRLWGVDHSGNRAIGTVIGSLSIQFSFARIYGSDGSITSLGNIGLGLATGLSSHGAVAVGWTTRSGATSFGQAFRSTALGVFEVLGSLPGQDYSIPNATNEDGTVIVGLSGQGFAFSDHQPASAANAFRWSTAEGMQDLGTLPGDATSEAFAVSADGKVVVGDSRPLGSPVGRAFLWSEDSGMLDLNAHLPTLGVDLNGWGLASATGISADGSVIVGEGWFNGASASWIVTGVPEPSTLALLLFSGLVASRRRR